MYRYRNLIFEEAQCIGKAFVIDFGNVLNLSKVITGAERTQLRAAPLDGSLAHNIGIRPSDAAVFFDVIDIGLSAVPIRHRPAGPFDQDPTQLLLGKFEVFTVSTDPRGHAGKKSLYERDQLPLDFFAAQT